MRSPRAIVVALLAAGIFLGSGPSATAGSIVYTSNECTATNPAFGHPSPDWQDECDVEILRMRDDGSEVRQLTSNRGHDSEPAWAPLGDKIAYVASDRDFGGTTNLYVMNADGRDVKRLTRWDRVDSVPRWSPDGLTVIFQSQDIHGSGFDLFTIRPDGSGLTQLTTGDDDYTQPTFSPDGRRIAFVRIPSGSRVPGDAQIWTMNADGSGKRPLSLGDVSMGTWSPRYSPLGDKLAFESNGRIFVSTADGDEFRAVTPPPHFYGDGRTGIPAWSPTGRYLLYSRTENETDSPYGVVHSDIYKRDLRDPGASPIRLTHTSRDGQGSGEPDWSLDPLGELAGPGEDTVPPVAQVVAGGTRPDSALTLPRKRTRAEATSAAKERLVMKTRARDLHFFVLDRRGIRSVAVAIGKRFRGQCRFVTSRGLARPRPCGKRIYVRIGQRASKWRKLTKKMKRGSYEITFRTTDVAGNKARGVSPVEVRLRD